MRRWLATLLRDLADAVEPRFYVRSELRSYVTSTLGPMPTTYVYPEGSDGED